MSLINQFKRIIPNGLRHALARVPTEVGIAWRHRLAWQRAKKWRGSVIKLHLGCYYNLKPGYVNVDLDNRHSLNLDLRQKLPFDNESVMEVYSEHLWEHLPEPYARQLFAECYRVLQPHGLFSVGVPNAQILLESYVRQLPVSDFKLVDREKDLPPDPTRMQIVNLLFHGFGHHYMYDFETIKKFLAAAGFGDIQQRAFDPTKDSAHRRDWTLYVDARKPL